MNEQQFQSEMTRAETFRRLATDPIQADYYAAYIRGLRRQHHGEQFGTAEEHELWMGLSDDPDPSRAARGRGYRDGLLFDTRENAQAVTNPSLSKDEIGELYRIALKQTDGDAKRAQALVEAFLAGHDRMMPVLPLWDLDSNDGQSCHGLPARTADLAWEKFSAEYFHGEKPERKNWTITKAMGGTAGKAVQHG